MTRLHMNHPTVLLAMLAVVATSIQGQATGNTAAKPPEATSVLLAELNKPDSSKRAVAYYRLIGAARRTEFELNAAALTEKALLDRASDRSAISNALIALLEREQKVTFSAAEGSLPEWYGDYIGDLIVSVGRLKSPSAVNALLGFITTGGGAIDGLIDIGPTALPPLLRVVDSSDVMVRSSAAIALGRMATRKAEIGLTAQQVTDIRAKLLAKLSDSQPNVRAGAIYGLRAFNDGVVRSAVLQLQQDSYSVGGAERRYPVRDAVKEWLRTHPN